MFAQTKSYSLFLSLREGISRIHRQTCRGEHTRNGRLAVILCALR